MLSASSRASSTAAIRSTHLTLNGLREKKRDTTVSLTRIRLHLRVGYFVWQEEKVTVTRLIRIVIVNFNAHLSYIQETSWYILLREYQLVYLPLKHFR